MENFFREVQAMTMVGELRISKSLSRTDYSLATTRFRPAFLAARAGISASTCDEFVIVLIGRLDRGRAVVPLRFCSLTICSLTLCSLTLCSLRQRR